MLLDHKANVMLEDRKEFTPLHHAAAEGHIECMKILMKIHNHTDVASHTVSRLVWEVEAYCEKVGSVTPLFIACLNGRSKAVELLLKHGSNVERTCDFASNNDMMQYALPFTPLFLAKSGKVCQLLLDHKASCSRALPPACLTPLLVNVARNQLENVMLLLNSPAAELSEIVKHNVRGISAIHLACDVQGRITAKEKTLSSLKEMVRTFGPADPPSVDEV